MILSHKKSRWPKYQCYKCCLFHEKSHISKEFVNISVIFSIVDFVWAIVLCVERSQSSEQRCISHPQNMLGLLFLTCGALFFSSVESTDTAKSTYVKQRTWTYQSTIHVDAMGMAGSAFAMHGRGLTTIVQGAELIYETPTATPTHQPSTVWVGSCVYDTDDKFVRCVNRQSPVYNADSNKPVCTLSYPVQTTLDPDVGCDGPGTAGVPYYYFHDAYGPGTPPTTAANVGDQYGAHVSLAGDLELGSLLAVGAPRTYDSTATFVDNYGAVYMHTGEYKRWTENQKLKPTDTNLELTANKPNFGEVVEIDKVTSRTALIACPNCAYVSLTEGSVYVYKTENGRAWSETQQLSCDDATTNDYQFGKNVKIHDEFAMISAVGLSNLGALYMFREERHSLYKDGIYNGQWTQQQKLVPNDATIRTAGSLWGDKADMHGKTLVVGQYIENKHGVDSGEDRSRGG
jgi:hypothetical protein